MSRLVLGTVQLGLPYGINNQSGQPCPDTARALIDLAYKSGIREFDTAQAYGTSEAVLGQIFRDLGIAGKVRIVSKISTAVNAGDTRQLDRALGESLKQLGVLALSGFMLHSEKQLDAWDQGLGQWLLTRREQKIFERIGVSVYSPVKAVEALRKDGVDFIQLPSNILDRRFDEAGVFALAAEKKKAVYIRSVYLQGLLLREAERLPPSMAFAREAVGRVQAFAKKENFSVKALCMGYVFAKWPEARIVFGAETPEQVKDNVELAETVLSPRVFAEADRTLACREERVLHPGCWPKE